MKKWVWTPWPPQTPHNLLTLPIICRKNVLWIKFGHIILCCCYELFLHEASYPSGLDKKDQSQMPVRRTLDLNEPLCPLLTHIATYFAINPCCVDALLPDRGMCCSKADIRNRLWGCTLAHIKPWVREGKRRQGVLPSRQSQNYHYQ